jgi:mono/diheme cytochrome c family protein
MNKKMQGLSQIVLMLACAAISVSSIASDTPAKFAAKAASSKEVERGRYLVNGPVACANCHTPRGPDMALLPNMSYAGGFKIVDPAFEVYTANITPDKDTGIGTWTDAQIITAIREGKTREGKINFPPMPVPTYNHMSDSDVKAIVAFLHTIKPIHHEVPQSKYNIPQQAMPPAKGMPAPSRKDKVAYGRYIATALAHCFECHSGPDAHGAPDEEHNLGSGGFLITLAPGATVMTPNITPDPETGIGKWSDADIKKALTQGIRPDGRHLSPPMPFPFFKNMTNGDLDAVIAFLHTIPPIKRVVERTAFQKSTFK